jgi:hypothetical protein
MPTPLSDNTCACGLKTRVDFSPPISHPLPLPTHLNLISWSVTVTKAVCQGDTALCQTEAASSIGHRSLPEGGLDHRSYAFFARQGSNSIVQKGASTHYWQCWGVGRGAWCMSGGTRRHGRQSRLHVAGHPSSPVIHMRRLISFPVIY